MSCLHPLVAIRQGVISLDGTKKIKIFRRVDESTDLENKYGRENILYLPCGHCAACQLKYRQDWSIRCEMEAMMHDKSCMITLTYDDQHLVDKPSKIELKKFLKSLRNRGIKTRFFACGERGSRTYRSHYHVILFGYLPDDIKYYGDSQSGEPMFSSKFLESVWNKGIVRVSLFDKRVAAYVAGYVNKKVNTDNFLIMSSHPGLGFDYMDQNINRLFKYQNYVGKNGRVYPLPRYFERVADIHGYYLDDLKDSKKEMSDKLVDASLYQLNVGHQVELFPMQSDKYKDKLSKLKRGF